MPLEYLRQISQVELPLTVEREAEIDKLRVLHAADLVSVKLPSPTDEQHLATVLSITPKGRAALSVGPKDFP